MLLRKKSGADTLIRVFIDKPGKIFDFPVGGDKLIGLEIDPGYYILKELKNISLVKDLPTDDRFVLCNTKIRRKQDLEVRFERETERDCKILLTDAARERTFFETSAKRKKSLTIPMADLPNGTYLLYVSNGSGQYVRKIVKTAY